ncbi:MAG TPA: VWA domain-containing protein [Candidatus Limiplasma pullistercoris]|nr:VWA domain-containing protein [Candidatus Limiplasma pullistercoris]
MKKNLTELVFILDKSGSMAGLERDTIGGFNAMLDKQKAQAGECRITTVLFDHRYELLHDRTDIRAVRPITAREYRVGGSTALLDALGKTIHKIATAQKNTSEPFRAKRVMFVIITDGEENASREYAAKEVKEAIRRQKSRYGWEFIFLGANIDAVETAGRFGIDAGRAANYVPDSQGTALNFRAMSETVSAFRACGAVPDACLDAVRRDMRKRGGRG